MHFLQPSPSSAASGASSHVSSNPRRSSRMVSGQFFLGLPLSHFLPEPSSSFGWLFYSCAFWPRDPVTSVFFTSDDAAHLLLSCSFPDCLVWYFIPP